MPRMGLLVLTLGVASAGCTRALSEDDFQKVVVWIENNGTYDDSSEAYNVTLPSTYSSLTVLLRYNQQNEEILVDGTASTDSLNTTFRYWTTGYQRSLGQIFYYRSNYFNDTTDYSSLITVDFTVSHHFVDTSVTNTFNVDRNPLKIGDLNFRQDSGYMPAAALNAAEHFLADNSVHYIL